MDYKRREKEIIEAYKESKEERLRLLERQKMCVEEMKEKFGVDSPSELQELLEKSERRVEKLEGKIEPLLDKLEGALGL